MKDGAGKRRESGSERGEGRIKTIIAILFVVALVYAGFKLIPVYVNNYQLEDAIKTEARFALAERKTPMDVKRDIVKKAQDLGISITDQDVQVSVTGNLVTISLTYTVPVDFPGYHMDLLFHPQADNRSI